MSCEPLSGLFFFAGTILDNHSSQGYHIFMSAKREQLEEQIMGENTGRLGESDASAPQENTGGKKLFEVSWAEYYKKEPFNGIINEFDFRRLLGALKVSTLYSIKADALLKARAMSQYDASMDAIIEHQIDQRVLQAENMAESAGIALDNTKGLDPRVLLYVIMRDEKRPNGAEFYHDDMTDNRLFEEILRMAGDAESVNKFVESRKVLFQKPVSKVTQEGYDMLNDYSRESLRRALEHAEREAKEREASGR